MDNLELLILNQIITNKKNALEFVNEYNVSIFSEEYWNIANILITHIKTYKDIPTLNVISDKLKNNQTLLSNVKKIWKEIESNPSNPSEFKYLIEKLKKRFSFRKISEMRESLSDISSEEADIEKKLKIISKHQNDILSLSRKKTFDARTVKEHIQIFKSKYNAKLKDPSFDRGIKTGYSYFDSATDGVREGELILIGAESGAGKSMLLMNMAIQLFLQENMPKICSEYKPGNSILYFSLEMPYDPCFNRFLARLAGVPSKKIRNASLNREELLRVQEVLAFLESYPNEFKIIDIPRGATMQQIESIYEDALLRFDPKIVVIDYLGLMDYEDERGLDDWLKLGKISEKMHEFARVHKVIVFSAVQLTRQKPTKESEDRVGLHRIGRSALIMTNANIAIQIETRLNEKQFPDMIYHLIKNRDGELGHGILLKELSIGRLTDMVINDSEFFDQDDISGRLNDMEFL